MNSKQQKNNNLIISTKHVTITKKIKFSIKINVPNKVIKHINIILKVKRKYINFLNTPHYMYYNNDCILYISITATTILII